jgi:Carboxypeptidase regulatory-like domain
VRISLILLSGALLVAGVPPMRAQGCLSVVVSQKLETSSAGVFQGDVHDSKGQLVTYLSLTLSGNSKPKVKQVIKTDDQGHFRFDSVPPGKYQIKIVNTSGTAKHTEVNCDTSGMCNIAFILKPLNSSGPCARPDGSDMQRSRMPGNNAF